MAANSATTGTYDVFLSFKGHDTRYGFTDYLYNDLISARVDTFRDNNELRVGEEIRPEIFKAIRDSKISIPIFSKNYAKSKWCLRELALMVECMQNGHQKILPVFYNVDPSEVKRYEGGSFNEAFIKYENDPNLDQNVVWRWKKTLAIVGELKGLELKKETNGLEGAFVKMIVQKILFELKKGYLHLPETLVGIDHHMERLKELLRSESNGVRIIGILGMSGLGKTTIAKAIYNELNESFDSHCFIDDVRGELQRAGLLNLQSQLLRKILKRYILDVHNVDEGSDNIRNAVFKKKVFLVFDNVDDMSKVEKLVVNHNWYGDGSRIIITTTNEEVLLSIKVKCERDGKFDVYEKYEPRLMGEEDAVKLFSKSAFKTDSPPNDYLELTKEVVSHAKGLPLVLETLGSLLSIENDKVCWEEKVKKLRKMPPTSVTERLRISYDALDFGQKQIFLDIACFFIGHDITKPFFMWDACGFDPSEGIRVLERRSLIKFKTKRNSVFEDEVKIVWMHDQLWELSKQIVNENIGNPWERSRLWIHCTATEPVQQHSGLKNMEAIRLEFKAPELFYSRKAPNWEYTYPCLQGQDFEMLPKLRYLCIVYADLVGDFKGVHTNLRCIRWIGCSGNSTPSNLHLNNLIVLDLSYSRIDHKWKWWNEIKIAKKVKVLDLSKCNYLGCVPHLSNFASLERLDLNSCASLCNLNGLEKLTSLTYLDVSKCCALETMPDLSEIRKLETLNISYLARLAVVHGLETLQSLKLLHLSYCNHLQKLPDLSNLRSLTSFKASGCSELTETRGLDGLQSLEHFHMVGCSSIKTFPDVITNKKLRTLKTSFSKNSEVQGLFELEALEILQIWSTECLDRLPDLSKLTRLRELEIHDCNKLIEIQDLRGLESLEFIHLNSCSFVKRIKFANLKRLHYVRIVNCWNLTEICGLEELESLKVLTISLCNSLENLPDLSKLKNLWRIRVHRCQKLRKILRLEQLTSLTELIIAGCDSFVKNLPPLPNRSVKWQP